MFKEDPTIRPSQEYEILNALFAAADAFCGNPRLPRPERWMKTPSAPRQERLWMHCAGVP